MPCSSTHQCAPRSKPMSRSQMADARRLTHSEPGQPAVPRWLKHDSAVPCLSCGITLWHREAQATCNQTVNFSNGSLMRQSKRWPKALTNVSSSLRIRWQTEVKADDKGLVVCGHLVASDLQG